MSEAATILLVEDEPMVRALLADLLQESGYTCVVAANAVDALKLIDAAAIRFDLLISDVVMPGTTNGMELTVEARRRDPRLRVLLISGYYDEELGAEIGAQGMRLLAKPFRHEQLLTAIRTELAGAKDAEIVPIRTKP
jgi:DNA-binding NtrC family response regulator